MSLTVPYDAEKKIAQEDIPCLKFLYTDDNGELRSPWMGALYKMGQTLNSKLGEKKELPASHVVIHGNKINFLKSISEGLHSFAMDCEDLTVFRDWFLYGPTGNGTYVGLIPKGAEYYEGKCNIIKGDVVHKGKAYASSQLTICGTLEEYLDKYINEDTRLTGTSD